MKNNILLVLAVAIISVGIIVATVLIATKDTGSSNSHTQSSDSTPDTSVTVLEEEESIEVTTTITTAPLPSDTSVPQEESPYDEEMAESIIATAYSLIGTDFVDSGETPDVGFDNSGFIYYVLRENGYITCPRSVEGQSEMGAALEYDELRIGDLAFFYGEDMTTVQFGGIYCGNGVMIACLMPGTTVKEVNISTPYYQQCFYRGVSIT